MTTERDFPVSVPSNVPVNGHAIGDICMIYGTLSYEKDYERCHLFYYSKYLNFSFGSI